jgi:acetyl esterase/lipase/HEAT repeat protein
MEKNQIHSACVAAITTLLSLTIAAHAAPKKVKAPSALFDPSDVAEAQIFTYKTIRGEEQKIEVYVPKKQNASDARVPGILMFHGGGWTGGDRGQFRSLCQYFATQGLVTATAEYSLITPDERKESSTHKRRCITDAKSAIRWFRENAAKFGMNPKQLIVGGGSAGGHVCLLSTLNPGLNDPNDNTEIDTSAIAYLLYNPAHSNGDLKDPEVSLLNFISKDLPPAIVFWGSEDNWKTRWDPRHEKINALGNDIIELHLAEGQSHGFANAQPWCDLTLIAAHQFLKEQNLLTSPPPKLDTEKQLKKVGNTNTAQAIEIAMDRHAPVDARLSALQSLKKAKDSEQPEIISALSDLILKEKKEAKLSIAAIQALGAFDWSTDEYALAALVLAREDNQGVWPHFQPATRALTSEQMGQRTSFAHAWDFDTVWECGKGDAHPILQKQEASKEKIAAGGTGTADDPFLVATAEQLDDIRNHLGSDKHFRQVSDIDLAGYGDPQKGWDPIGRGEAIGSYDGGGYTIRNLSINRPNMDNVGLFGSLAWGKDDAPGRLSRIALENVTIVGRNQTGSLVGQLGDAHAEASKKTVVKNCYATGTVSGAGIVGGLAGRVFSCQVIHCHVAVAVDGADNQAAPFVQRLWWGAAADSCFYNADLAGTENVAIAALRVLRRYRPKLDTSAYLYELLRADDAFLRAKAAELARGIPPDRLSIEPFLDDRYPVRRLAWQLAQSQGSETTQRIISQLANQYIEQNKTPEQRVKLARAAGELGTEASVALLIQALADPSADVRRVAIEGLQWMGITDLSRENTIGPQSLWWKTRPEEAGRTAAALQPIAANDLDSACREAAVAALARITGKNLPPDKEEGDIYLGDQMTWPKVSDHDNEILSDTYARCNDNRLKIIQSFANGVQWPYSPNAEVRYATAQMYLDQNLEAANKRLKSLIDLPTYGSEAGGLGAAIYPMVYGTFYSKSRVFPGRLSKENEDLFQERMITFINWVSKEYFDTVISNVWYNKGTENHHLCFGPPLWYMYLEYLSEDPEYANRKIHKDKTVAEWHVNWRDYMRKFLKERALNGMWMEIGSGYQKYSYTAYYSLLLSKDKIIQQRSKMFLDLSFIEQAQISYRNARGGGRSRATDPGEHSFVLEALYGQKILNHHIGMYEAMICGYQPPPEAVLLRKKYQYPEKPIFIINTRPGELIGEDTNTHKPDTSLVNYCYKTRHFSIGGTLQPVNARVSPIVNQKRWNGLLFADGDGVYPAFGGGVLRIGIPYYHIQNEATMILQRRKEPRPSKMLSEIHVKFNTNRVQKGDWLFIDNGKAYCAVRVAQGDFKLQEKVTNKQTDQKILYLIPNDSFTPIVIQGGDVDAYGSFDKFMASVSAQPFEWDEEKLNYNGIEFFNINSTPGKNSKINGREFEFRLSKKYSSPFMNSVGKSKIGITVGDLVTTYDFDNNTIERNSE